MKVPFLDLHAQSRRIMDEVRPQLEALIEKSAFAGGPWVERFESEFARFCGVEHAIGCSNGTEALWMALIGLGIGPGDEVITAANSFIATAEAISFAGATPIFVDIDAATHCIDPDRIEAAITPRTRAIVPVHLYGQMAEIDVLRILADRHGLHLIEDAAQAHGALDAGRGPGAVGDAAAFSFYPGKNLGAWGEAGAVVTRDGELAERLRRFRDHGQSQKYHHAMIGWNARMDGIQAAVLSAKLRHLPEWNESRRRHAAHYDHLLSEIEEVLQPVQRPGTRHVWHLYVVRVAERERLIEQLRERGVACGIHYPVPIHRQPAYAETPSARARLPVTEVISEQLVSLPMFAELEDGQVEWVVTSIRECLQVGVR